MMNRVRDNQGSRVSWCGGRLLLTTMVMVAMMLPSGVLASSRGDHCGMAYEATADYPLLSSAGVGTISEPGIVVYLERDRAVIEVEGCFHVADIPVEIDTDTYDNVSLLFEINANTAPQTVFVSVNNEIKEMTELGPMFSYLVGSEEVLGFELASAGQALPTEPVIVFKPQTENPDPSCSSLDLGLGGQEVGGWDRLWAVF